MLKIQPFGNTSLTTSILGFGAGQIGDNKLSEATVATLLNETLDLGITLIDTARGYGLSEERIGRHIAHRRDEYVLSTKVGYDVDGHENWTYDAVIAGVDRARRVLNSDILDIVHLHSCPQATIIENGLADALAETVTRGWVRVPAYSGDNDDLAFAVASGGFGSLQTSLNLFDQRGIDGTVADAKQRGMGIIAKRTIGNAPWRFSERPVGAYCEPYWERWQAMELALDLPILEVALRFTAFSSGADCSIVGTTNLDHLRQNVAMVQKGPLPDEVVAHIRRQFQQHDDDWVGQI